jgi:hypothetical protein
MNQKLPVPESHRDKPFVVKHEIRALADPWLGSHPAAVEHPLLPSATRLFIKKVDQAQIPKKAAHQLCHSSQHS